MSRKIEYLKTGAIEYVYEIPSAGPESSGLFVSFKKIDDIFDLLKSCNLIAEDPELQDMTITNTIYLDTITNKTPHKKQTKFLLAPILPKLEELGMKYVVLFPSILEAYTKAYGSTEGLKVVGSEYKKMNYNKEQFMNKLLQQRRDLATKVYEPLGFKSYDPCPGFLPNNPADAWQYEYYRGLKYTNSNEKITYYDERTGNNEVMLIPSQYWMIAKVKDIHRILLSDCLSEQLKQSKQAGIKFSNEKKDYVTQVINQITELVSQINVENFADSVKQINTLIHANKTDLTKLFIDPNFTQNVTELLQYANEIQTNTISSKSLTKCLRMIKESEELEQWTLSGGSVSSFFNGKYLKISQEQEIYKIKYQKYKTKYLNLKKHLQL